MWTPIFATSVVALMAAAIGWARPWIYSGCAIESLLLMYGYSATPRTPSLLDLWPTLSTLNLIYAVSSTSWLLYWLFTAACYPIIFVTCVWQFQAVADVLRRLSRKWLRQLHFTRDKIALFNLPALEIDTDVSGLLVIRGVTISLSTLTLIAHGVELGIKLTPEIEMAISADEVIISLFRRVEVGEVFANVKGGSAEMMFGNLGDSAKPPPEESEVFLVDTPIMRAATAGASGFKDRPQLRSKFTGVPTMKDTSPNAALGPVTFLSAYDEAAEQQYLKTLEEIKQTSAVGYGRQTVKHRMETEDEDNLNQERHMRNAVVVELQGQPSVPHPPSQCVRVTKLRSLAPQWQRRFMHRLPMLYRLLLSPISYLHTVTIKCITTGVSGKWIASMLNKEVYKHYPNSSAEIRRLEAKTSAWLDNANFVVQLESLAGLGQVPLSTVADILAQLKVADIRAYRSLAESNASAQVVQLGGADVTMAIPIYLLPHHEHIVPERVGSSADHANKERDSNAKKDVTITSDATPNDEATITFTAHASLPAAFDQSLLGFVAAIVKVTKVIEFEKDVDDVPVDMEMNEGDAPLSPTSPTSTEADSDTASTTSKATTAAKRAKVKAFARKLRSDLKDGTTGQQIKDLAKEWNQATRDGMKKAVVVGMVNDSWIAKMVGKIATKLQQAQGSVGYSYPLPLPLEPYRSTEDGHLSKLLP